MRGAESHGASWCDLVDPYDVLGVGPDTTPTELRVAYHRLARESHPDLGGSNRRMADLNAAYAAVRHRRTDAGTVGPTGSRTRRAARVDSDDVRPPAPRDVGGAGRTTTFVTAVAFSPVARAIALLVGGILAVRTVALLLGPPLDSALFLQAWVAVSIAWLAHGELGASHP